MLRDVAARLASDGHQITVLCVRGGYAGGGGTTPGENAGVRVIRIGATRFGRGSSLAKITDYLSFYLGVAWRLLRHPADRVVALTTPPYLSVLARLATRCRGGTHAHWVMDLYPDVMTAHGMIRHGGMIHRALAALARWGMGGRRCAAVVTLGPDMAARINALCRRKTSSWVPLWHHPAGGIEHASDERAMALRRTRGWNPDELVVMYSGNMGLGHRFSEILAAARDMRGKPVRFAFFGGGRRRGEIEQFIRTHPDCGVELHDYAPHDQLADHLRSADVHLASLRPEWDGTMVPSKLQGIFAVGRPAIFIGTRESSIGRWILECGGGDVVPPDDPAALVAAIEGLLDPSARAAAGRAALDHAERHFQPAENIARTANHLTRG